MRELQLADLDAVARVHRSAFPSSTLTRLGRSAVRRYYQRQFEEGQELHAYGAFNISAMGGFLVGGRFKGALSDFLRLNRLHLALLLACRPWVLFDPYVRARVRQGIRILWPGRKGHKTQPVRRIPQLQPDLGILAIAVDPSLQKSGVGRLLMAHFEEAARNAHHSRICLSVNPGNQSAIRFYEKLGWQKSMVGSEWSGGMEKTLS